MPSAWQYLMGVTLWGVYYAVGKEKNFKSVGIKPTAFPLIPFLCVMAPYNVITSIVTLFFTGCVSATSAYI
jgi:hypothetical protein